MDRKLIVADVSYIYGDELSTKEDLLRKHFTTVGCAEALVRAGAEVIVFKRFHEDAEFEMKGVKYVFYDDRFAGKPEFWQLTLSYNKLIASYKPDIIHVHGLVFPTQTLALKMQKNGSAILVVQHQGAQPFPGFKRWIQRACLFFADAYFFATRKQGIEWLGHTSNKIMPVMEGSNDFAPSSRDNARGVTGIEGQPVFLWVGTLDENKDPFTVLQGFEWVLSRYPEAKLYMVFNSGEMLAEVKELIYRNDKLHQSVVLIGKIEPHSMQRYFNSADYFVLGSHYEGYGYSLSEALACGCIPVVTDIPSFRMMTDDGKLGALWEPGNKESMIAALENAMEKDRQTESEACAAFFREHLTYDAIAGKTLSHYKSLKRL